MTETQERIDQRQQPHISQLLRQFLNQHPQDQLCLGDLLAAMGDRAFGPTLLLCALPEALPLPVAGISAVVAIPLLLVSTQLMLGFRRPWLPRRLLTRPFPRQQVEPILQRAIHNLEKLERVFKPRWLCFTQPLFERWLGLLLVLLSLVIALPIPFGNMLPALVIVLICVGMIERDGLVLAFSGVLMGLILALAAIAIAQLPPINAWLRSFWLPK